MQGGLPMPNQTDLQEKESLVVIPGEGVELIVQVRNHSLIVDQPVEDGGKNGGMTPVELFVSSLGGCIGYYAVRFCQRHKISSEGLKVSVDWDYAEGPHRIGSMAIRVDLPKGWNPEMNDRFHNVLEGCTVQQTIKYQPKIEILLK